MKNINLKVLPRISLPWEEFVKTAPKQSIGLDGVVLGGPRFDDVSMHLNLDHHDNVVREATMSTAEQAYYAVKGGLFKSFTKPTVYINDTDQDTTLAVYILENHQLFEGAKSIPEFNRLLELDSRLDVTGGAFPMNLEDELLQQHSWVFEPYTEFRRSGKLSNADENMMRENIESMMPRITALIEGKAEKIQLNTEHEIVYQSEHFMMINEKGATHARYYLFSKGMDAFISIVAKRSDNKYVYSIGRRSRFIPFPVIKLYEKYNLIEGLKKENGWGGSDIIGGSSRKYGSNIKPLDLAHITQEYINTGK
ncbi:MAG: hypothetical protein ACP5N1_05455 [Candidatus Woesearchaeota archaeon]